MTKKYSESIKERKGKCSEKKGNGKSRSTSVGKLDHLI